MSGVDHSDQMIAYAPLHRKIIKWWKKLAFHLITLVMVQAHCLHNKQKKSLGQSTKSLVDFAISVCTSIADFSTQSETGVARDANLTADRLIGRHFLEEILNPRGQKVQRNCRVCYARQIKQGTTVAERKNKVQVFTQCKTCKVPLCAVPCMEIFHTKKVYDQ